MFLHHFESYAFAIDKRESSISYAGHFFLLVVNTSFVETRRLDGKVREVALLAGFLESSRSWYRGSKKSMAGSGVDDGPR